MNWIIHPQALTWSGGMLLNHWSRLRHFPWLLRGKRFRLVCVSRRQHLWPSPQVRTSDSPCSKAPANRYCVPHCLDPFLANEPVSALMPLDRLCLHTAWHSICLHTNPTPSLVVLCRLFECQTMPINKAQMLSGIVSHAPPSQAWLRLSLPRLGQT